LKGIGAIITPRTQLLCDTISTTVDVIPDDLIAVFGYSTPYELNEDSSYQNSMEFISGVFVIAVLASRGHRNVSLIFEGDNTTSLKWSITNQFAGKFGTAAFLAYMLISRASGIMVSQTKHISGILMDNRSDKLSRGHSPEEYGYPMHSIQLFHRNPVLIHLAHLLNPSSILNLSDDLSSLWRELDDIVVALMSGNGGWVDD
jgi:hypothetical protein